MRKIGVLCYWGVPNYGAWAQAYALNNVVREISGEENVLHISYLEPGHFKSYYKGDERLYNSFNYSYQLIPHTKHFDAVELEKEKFDVIITGSDAIWEFSTPQVGDDVHLIGNGLYTDKLISYAASFGDRKEDADLEVWLREIRSKLWIEEGLKKYDYISVRDANSYEIVKRLTGIESTLVLDPVLLWDFKGDKQVLEPAYDSYIAVYGAQWESGFIIEAKRFASEKKCKLVSIGFINDWCDISLRMIELRGLEWIGMIKHADYVLTSTFHGLMFSLLFEKQFKFNRVPYVMQRSETLIKEIKGGMEVYLGQSDIKQIFEKELDYNIIRENIEKLKKYSIEFLSSVLEDN